VPRKNLFNFLSPWSIALLLVLSVMGCQDDKPSRQVPVVKHEAFTAVPRPAFDADSAYVWIEKQVAFGPRVPGTPQHAHAAKWLAQSLRQFGWDVLVQEGEAAAFNKKILPIINIMGRYRPDLSERILLFAHWDTRPFADRDVERQNEPIIGANDGGSGVGVLLEIARLIGRDSLKPEIGIDILFLDAEDYGQPQSGLLPQQGNTWCLGAQYWANNRMPQGYTARFGILLDMVGAADAVFPREAVSMQYAPQIVSKVWVLARKMGYGGYFIDRVTDGGITDDHLYINQLAGIPSIDIIHYDPQQRDFGHFHHTHKDNMDIIDKATLKAVGEVVMELLYREK
jgi:hypothetical protein